MSEVNVYTDGFEGHVKRSLARAERRERGERLPVERAITFEDPLMMLECLTKERVRLFEHVAESGGNSISALAKELGRDIKSVHSDVSKLEELGLLQTRLQTNPGHGRVRVIKPVARRVNLRASLGGTGRRKAS